MSGYTFNYTRHVHRTQIMFAWDNLHKEPTGKWFQKGNAAAFTYPRLQIETSVLDNPADPGVLHN